MKMKLLLRKNTFERRNRKNASEDSNKPALPSYPNLSTLDVTSRSSYSLSCSSSEKKWNETSYPMLVETEKSVLDHEKIPSKFKPNEMRCLALVAHNNMKAAMKEFVIKNKHLLKHFRLTGTNSTMTMIKSVFKDDDNIVLGPDFKSGPLGGDAQLGSLMCMEDVGGIVFFMDPMSAHPHEADITTLIRLANVHNIPLVTNPSAAHVFTHALKHALVLGKNEMIPSFFCTLESPSVELYRRSQSKIIQDSLH